MRRAGAAAPAMAYITAGGDNGITPQAVSPLQQVQFCSQFGPPLRSGFTYATTTANCAFSVTPAQAGTYLVTYALSTSGPTFTAVYVNFVAGAGTNPVGGYAFAEGQNAQLSPSSTVIVQLNAGDVLDVRQMDFTCTIQTTALSIVQIA
jgi:hypothetical protein